jgi:hypothetical protein
MSVTKKDVYDRKLKMYDIQTTVIYTGFAMTGTATSSVGWTIKRNLFDIDGNPTSEMWTADDAAVWDDRATESYS